jgi:hypothetical protein
MVTHKKIKVLHIIEALGGGVYSYFTDLTHAMGQDERVKLYVAYSDKRDEIDSTKVAEDFHENTNLILLELKKEISPIKDWQGIQKIKEIIQEVGPDVVHLHSSKAGILGKIALFQIGFKKPSYYTPHGYSFLRQDVSRLKKWLYKTIEFLFTRYSNTTTIACGDTELEYAREMSSTARLIRNGIDPEKISFRKEHQSVSKTTIGILGRISYPKNPKRFNHFALKLLDHPFLWIGSGELKNALTSPNIKTTGWFNQKSEAIPYLQHLDIYLQPSLWEGLPIAVIEAMAMGLPVIASNVIGNKDLVEHGKTGFLIETDEDFFKYVHLLEDVELRRSMGEAARIRVQELFNSTKNFKALVDLYLGDLASNNQQTN